MTISSSSQFMVTLYIHPDSGPVTPMQLDMLSIETTILGLDAHSNRDDARIRQIAAKIKATFPDVDPYRNLGMLSQFVSRMSHVALFSGVVLRLPGTIQGASLPTSPDAADYAQKIQETITLRAALDDCEQRFETVDQLLPALKKQNEQLQRRNKQLDTTLNDIRVRVDSAENHMQDALAETQRQRDKSDKLEQENAALHVREEELQRECKSLLKFKNEVADLRQELIEERKAHEQFKETLEKRDLKIKALVREIEDLSKGSSAGRRDAGGKGWEDKNYLD